MNPEIDSARSHFDVIVVGGGNAGIGAAAHLRRRGITDIAVIEPQLVHTYRPMLSYVGSGQAPLAHAERTQRSVTPTGCSWLRDSVVAVDPDAGQVHCASGRVHGYNDLILATGLVPDHDDLPGIDDALASTNVASNYLDAAEKTWQLVQDIPRGGHAVFTVPRPPVSCTGTTIKPLFLAAGQWRRERRLSGITMTLVVDRADLTGIPKLDAALRTQLNDLGVRLLHRTAVTGIDIAQQEIDVSGPDGARESIAYDMLHLVPPFRGPEWVTTSGLAGASPHGLADIDSTTFRHRTHPTVWAIGDGAAVDTDPSGGALRIQAKIVAKNLVAQRSGGSMTTYDGYTVSPIATAAHHLIAAEFDRTKKVSSSLPTFFDPVRPRRRAWIFDRYGLPVLYWNLILKGLI